MFARPKCGRLRLDSVQVNHAQHATPDQPHIPPASRPKSALFERGLVIEADDSADERWECDGGKRAEYIDILNRLHSVLGLKA